MRSSVTSNVVVGGFAAGLLLAMGCSSGEGGGDPINPFTMPQAGASGTPFIPGGGSPPGGGSGNTAGSSSGGVGTAGTPPGGGAPPGGQSPGGASGSGGGGGGEPPGGSAITAVLKTEGCGKAPGATGKQTIATMGTKDAGCAAKVCGAWTYPREYGVTLPQGYDMNKAYPLVFQGPGCGGNYQGIYDLDGSVDNTVIRVGLTPGPNTAGHGTNPNQGCFDDKEGDDSIDWIFYETLHDHLATQFCFDKNRVFASGNSSGAWFSNEVGCKYAGDAQRPIRGIMPNTGGLPSEPQFKPTCSDKGMAGMWIHETGDQTNPFSGNIYAINRAMVVNKCAQQTWETAQKENFPIPDNGATTCQRILNCDPLFPLVVCPLGGNGHGSHDNVANPGFATFIKLFSAGTLITQ